MSLHNYEGNPIQEILLATFAPLLGGRIVRVFRKRGHEWCCGKHLGWNALALKTLMECITGPPFYTMLRKRCGLVTISKQMPIFGTSQFNSQGRQF